MEDRLLTAGQQNPLLAMVRFQQQQDRDIRFTIPLGGLAISFEDAFFTLPPHHARELWETHGYVFVTPGKMYRPVPDEPGSYFSSDALVLTLTQKAIDLERWLNRPSWQRWLIRQKNAWSSEIKAAVVSLITAVIISILTLLVLRWLGLS